MSLKLADWLKHLATSPSFEVIREELAPGVCLTDICFEARPPLLATNWLAHPKTLLILTRSYETCLQWQAKLSICGLPQESIFVLPSGVSSLFEDAAPETLALSDRAAALRGLSSGEDKPVVVISTLAAALERTLPKEDIDRDCLTLKIGNEFSMDNLLRSLASLSYEREEPVLAPTHYSQRGGIVDVWIAGQELPVRIEFFGDQIETIRAVDPETQRSLRSLDSVEILPARETLFHFDSQENADQLAQLLRDTAAQEAMDLDEAAHDRLLALIDQDAEHIARQSSFDRIDLYRPLLHPDAPSALDLVPQSGLIVLDEPQPILSATERAEQDLGEALRHRAARGEILSAPVNDFLVGSDAVGHYDNLLVFTMQPDAPGWLSHLENVSLEAKALEALKQRPQVVPDSIRNWNSEKVQVVICTDQPSRTVNLLAAQNIGVLTDQTEGSPILLQGNLGGGFELLAAGLVFLTDAEMYGVARLRLPQRRFREGVTIATLLDLKAGDFIVHINFGIGRFVGLESKVIDGIEKEYLVIEYQAPDRLYVPTDQLDRIQKYLNPSDGDPKLNKIGGSEWQKTVSAAKVDARAFAAELVKLYAERHTSEIRPFDPDSPFQKEMEDTFPWVETKAQLSAIADVKADLQSGIPMDRLICGDVGFGKTEVAIRAAFKTILEGMQVAILCPTTILAEQHYRNFKERLTGFDLNLQLLNRFTSDRDRKEILKGIESGGVQIVIGTHALLAKSIQFHNLGLIVVDEEQRFGVKQKEALKRLRKNVHVLSMSATPIPRTLSMALMDLRKMSLIDDPPPGRLPIRSYVRGYDEGVVREAIFRELARGGQVFYIHNRVDTIELAANRLAKVVPHARIGVGHGQMDKAHLEKVMMDFVHGEVDVLLATTIIENGIDIPNANTLIVEDAHHLGLAQLYQLRGRVGRSDRQAYSYFLYPVNMVMTENAEHRLEALQEFGALGSGYSLAYRDLQIRGAGELLGAKQHGPMANVGYEMYSQLIQEAIEEIKLEDEDGLEKRRAEKHAKASFAPLPAVDLPVEAYLPDSYIPQQSHRLYYYKQISMARTRDDLHEVEEALVDRYGRLPEPAKRVLDIMAFRISLVDGPVFEIAAKGPNLIVSFVDEFKLPTAVLRSINSRFQKVVFQDNEFRIAMSGDPFLFAVRFDEILREQLVAHEAALARLGI